MELSMLMESDFLTEHPERVLVNPTDVSHQVFSFITFLVHSSTHIHLVSPVFTAQESN